VRASDRPSYTSRVSVRATRLSFAALLGSLYWVVSLALNRYPKDRLFMFSGLLIILLPLIVGYLIPLHRESALRLINRFLSWIVYVILFFMGISLAFWITGRNLLAILHYSIVTVVVILLCNIAALFWLERTIPWKNHHHQENCLRELQWRWNH
jgi:drug/metabolite transporter (DMT)-like permease